MEGRPGAALSVSRDSDSDREAVGIGEVEPPVRTRTPDGLDGGMRERPQRTMDATGAAVPRAGTVVRSGRWRDVSRGLQASFRARSEQAGFAIK